MLRLYRCLLALYPAAHRDRFGEEMVTVFSDVKSELSQQKTKARAAFYIRESSGMLAGALREHLRSRLTRSLMPFPAPRRFNMHTEFRFPKTTAVLMTIILAGVVLAIRKGEAIEASLPHVNPPLAPIVPTHSTLLPGIVWGLALFYAAGLLGWAILYALHRSGVHRLSDVAGE
jgi:hypothetical protein